MASAARGGELAREHEVALAVFAARLRRQRTSSRRASRSPTTSGTQMYDVSGRCEQAAMVLVVARVRRQPLGRNPRHEDGLPVRTTSCTPPARSGSAGYRSCSACARPRLRRIDVRRRPALQLPALIDDVDRAPVGESRARPAAPPPRASARSRATSRASRSRRPGTRPAAAPRRRHCAARAAGRARSAVVIAAAARLASVCPVSMSTALNCRGVR